MINSNFHALKLFVAATVIASSSLTSAAATSASPHSTFARQFPARVLAVHQAERARVLAPVLMWDDNLGNSAAIYAAQMAITNRFQHSNPELRRGVGENLWMGTRGAFAPEDMVRAWASEQRKFVPGIFPHVVRNGNWSEVGHYTQMIWPTTQRIGCALASNTGTDYLVCHYSSAGNINGRSVGLPQNKSHLLATTRWFAGPHDAVS